MAWYDPQTQQYHDDQGNSYGGAAYANMTPNRQPPGAAPAVQPPAAGGTGSSPVGVDQPATSGMGIDETVATPPPVASAPAAHQMQQPMAHQGMGRMGQRPMYGEQNSGLMPAPDGQNAQQMMQGGTGISGNSPDFGAGGISGGATYNPANAGNFGQAFGQAAGSYQNQNLQQRSQSQPQQPWWQRGQQQMGGGGRGYQQQQSQQPQPQQQGQYWWQRPQQTNQPRPRQMGQQQAPQPDQQQSQPQTQPTGQQQQPQQSTVSTRQKPTAMY